MEYYSAIKKNEILPFATTWMNLEDIMLSEISQKKANTAWYHLYVESKKKKSQTHRNRVEWSLPGAGWWEKQGESGERVQILSYKMNKV